MRSANLTLCLILTLNSLALTQGQPTVPAELSKFDRLIGNWEGTGTAMMGPDGPAAPWTASSTIKKVLDGFFLQEDVVIDLGEVMPMPIVFRTFYAYDQQTQKYMTLSVGNMGAPTASQIHWADDNTMVSVDATMEGGQFMQDRWVTKLEKDVISFKGFRSPGAGPTFPHIEGRMTRTKTAFTPPAPAQVPSGAPANPEMAQLLRMAGKYRLDGWFRPVAEMEPMTIGATETYAPIFGSSILEMNTVGDDNPAFGVYKAWSAYGFSDWKKSFVAIHLNNMGEMASTEGRFVDGHLVFTHSSFRMGVPSLSRSIFTFDSNGKLAKLSAHGMTGASAPLHEFEATYKLQK
jgi:hypothetical protein